MSTPWIPPEQRPGIFDPRVRTFFPYQGGFMYEPQPGGRGYNYAPYTPPEAGTSGFPYLPQPTITPTTPTGAGPTNYGTRPSETAYIPRSPYGQAGVQVGKAGTRVNLSGMGQAKNRYSVENIIGNLIRNFGAEALGLPSGTTPEAFMESWNAWKASIKGVGGRAWSKPSFRDYLAENPIGEGQVGLQQSGQAGWAQNLINWNY